MNKKDKEIIGWREHVDLPDWGIRNLKAKIDTGAKSCSLHVEDVKALPRGKISFNVVLNDNKMKKVVATILRRGKVKSSIGIRTHRWFVQTTLRIGEVSKKVKINLSDRGEMNFRMLVGRMAIENHFLVDVTHGYLLEKKQKDNK